MKKATGNKCICETPTFQMGPIHGVLICGVCGGNYPGNPETLPRKEVISIQPGDVITIKQDNPIEWLSFCVTDSHSNRITFPRGKFVLEVYREQGNGPGVAMDTGLCDVMGEAITVGCTIEAHYNTKDGFKDIVGVIEFEMIEGLSCRLTQETKTKHGWVSPNVLDISDLRNMKIVRE